MDDIIELSATDASSWNPPMSNTSFGSGIELLMNDKKKDGGSSVKKFGIDIDDLTSLENDLNSLSDIGKSSAAAPHARNALGVRSKYVCAQ